MKLEDRNNKIELAEIESESNGKVWTRNFVLSLLIHIALIISLLFIYDVNQNKAKINPEFLSVETRQYDNTSASLNEKSEKSNLEQQSKNTNEQESKEEITQFVSFSDLKSDTTNLDQVYKESTLNLSIKYPKGWTYIDQNKNKKLDGVTFWSVEGNYNPPPYIHLDVVDKYLFNEKKYKYKTKLSNCIAYYNDPEELSGQVTQVFYLRTDTDEDFVLKLIVNGMQTFNSFQPKFLAILKSFKFKTSFF
jgi:hypothetical protein